MLLGFVSCYTGADSGVCLYNTEITYRYYSGPRTEEFDKIGTQSHLLFRGDTLVGTLFLTANGSKIGAGLLSNTDVRNMNVTVRKLQVNLPAGAYDLYTWSNYFDGYSRFSELVIGESMRQNIDLIHSNSISRSRAPGSDMVSNSERLYSGEVKFEVLPIGRTAHTVDLLCAHTQFTFVVRWLSNPPDMNPLELQMENVPLEYLHSISHPLTMTIGGVPLYGSNRVYQQVPNRGAPLGTVVTPAVRLSSREATATMITYRHWDDNHDPHGHDPVLSIWGSTNTESQVMKTVPIGNFFDMMGWQFTNNMKQYFDILVEIDGDKIYMSELDNIGWIPGPIFGGGA